MIAPVTLDLEDADVTLYPGFFPPVVADRLLQELRESTMWRQEAIKMYGKAIPVPRLTAWHGDEGTGYKYSGIENLPQPWTAALREVKQAIEPLSGVTFNSVLANRYRTGRDSVSWHADDEAEFGPRPVIASVSFGGTRVFQLRHKTMKGMNASIDLTHGSLLMMRGGTQEHWVHQVPKTSRAVAERLNLTFRVVVTRRE